MSEQGEDRDTPDAMADDALKGGGPRPDPIADSPAGMLLRDVLEAMHGAGEQAEERYQAALDELRERPGEVLVEIARALGDCSAEDYPLRWSLVYAASELRNRAALPLLRTVVLTPIPAERSKDTHSFSTVAEETALRTTAVEGVGALARDGSEDAIEALFDFLEIDSISIRRAGVQGLLGSPQADDLRDRILECLPKNQHFLADLKRVDVTDVEQISDPTVHLSDRGRTAEKAEPPRFSTGEPGDTKRESPKAD